MQREQHRRGDRDLEPLRAFVDIGVRADGGERLRRAVDRVREGLVDHDHRPEQLEAEHGHQPGEAVEQQRRAAVVGVEDGGDEAARAVRLARRQLDLAQLLVEPDRALAVAQHAEQVGRDARPGQRRRDDVGDRGDVAVRHRLGDLLRDPRVEDRHHQRYVLVEVADEQRDPQREGVVARGDADHVGARLQPRAQVVVVGVLEPAHLGAGGVQRLAHLLREVPSSHEQHAPALGHARHPTQISTTCCRTRCRRPGGRCRR